MQKRLSVFAAVLVVASVAHGQANKKTGRSAISNSTAVQARGSTVPLQLQDWFAVTTNVKAFNAKGDGVTDDTTAIQAAIASTPTGRIFFPCGTYATNTGFSLASSAFGTLVQGQNQSCVTIKATAAMAAVFQFADTSSNAYFSFRELRIDGNQLAQKGIASTKLADVYIDRIVVLNTTVAAVDLAEGWNQNITASGFQNNAGDGLRLGTNANNVRVEGCVASSNRGWGITVRTGVGVNLRNNDIEANALGGIYIAAGAGTAGAGTVNVKDNYFEGNATSYITGTLTSGSASVTASAAAVAIAAANIGHAILGPSIPAGTTITAAAGTTITMSAAATATATETDFVLVGVTLSAVAITTDILFNGSLDPTVLAQSFPISNANVEGNTTTSHGANRFVSYSASAVVNLRVVGNTHTTAYSNTGQLPFTSFGSPGALVGMTVQNNTGFTGSNSNGPHFHDRTALSCGTGTATIDLAVAEEFVIIPATSAACTLAAPANVFWNTTRPQYQYITIRIRNQLGGGAALGALAIASGAGGYRMGAWTQPADGFSRSITFSWDLSSNAWVEVSRTPFDVAN
jgi:parallel beta-helix repeat protein